MPVTRFGPRCPRCNIGPAIDDGPCHRCRLLARLTGVPPEHRGGTLVLSSESPLFDAELERWRMGGAE